MAHNMAYKKQSVGWLPADKFIDSFYCNVDLYLMNFGHLS
jgi:hypothetical protein